MIGAGIFLPVKIVSFEFISVFYTRGIQVFENLISLMGINNLARGNRPGVHNEAHKSFPVRDT